MAVSVLLLLLISLASTSASEYNIIEILQPFRDYTTFTKYLTDTKMADKINSLPTVTVLVVGNIAIGPLASLSTDDLKKVISLHVLSRYYDPYTLYKLPNKTALLPTLLAATGPVGLLNYTALPGEVMAFGSAEAGAPLNASIVKVAAARPYKVSVLEITAPIVPPSISKMTPGCYRRRRGRSNCVTIQK